MDNTQPQQPENFVPISERPTLQELAAQSSGDGKCPKCGCRDLRLPTDSTWMLNNGTRRRRRVCRNCGYGPIHTSEVACPPGHEVIVVPKGKRLP